MDHQDKITWRRPSTSGCKHWQPRNDDSHTIEPTWIIQNIVEILEYELDDEDNPLTIEIIRDKILDKYNQMNEK